MKHSNLILYNLMKNNDYTQAVLPYLKDEYFSKRTEQILFIYIYQFITTYSSLPTFAFLKLKMQKDDRISDQQLEKLEEKIDFLESTEPENYDLKWLIDETEEYCRSVAIENAVITASEVISDSEKIKERQYLPELFREALAIDFKSLLGIEFFNPEDVEKRFKKYLEKADRYKTGISTIDKVLGGGFVKKTLNLITAGTHIGKTAMMCSFCKNMVQLGYNVVYITLEMSEEMIAQRHEANILDTEINDVPDVNEKKFKNDLKKFAETSGNLWIKEFPTMGANTNHFKSYLSELKLKKGFVPDILFVDYLGITLPIRNVTGLYESGKCVAEELRALGVRDNYCVISATQTVKAAYNSSSPELTDNAESWGIPQTADVMFSFLTNDELREQGRIIAIPLKNRLTGILKTKIELDVNYAKARFTDTNSKNPQRDMSKFKPSKNPISNLLIKKQDMRDDKRKLKTKITDKDREELDKLFQ